MLLTGLAWGITYTLSFASTVRVTLLFVFVHFIAVSVIVATASFFLVGRLLGPGIAGLPGRKRQQGLFTPVGEAETLEFGYCFDVSARSLYGGGLVVYGQENGSIGESWLTRGGPGRYKGILSRLGDALRYPVSAVATDIQRLLVGAPKSVKGCHVANAPCRIALFLGNTLYAVALGYYTVICFLGYNGSSGPLIK